MPIAGQSCRSPLGVSWHYQCHLLTLVLKPHLGSRVAPSHLGSSLLLTNPATVPKHSREAHAPTCSDILSPIWAKGACVFLVWTRECPGLCPGLGSGLMGCLIPDPATRPASVACACARSAAHLHPCLVPASSSTLSSLPSSRPAHCVASSLMGDTGFSLPVVANCGP